APMLVRVNSGPTLVGTGALETLGTGGEIRPAQEIENTQTTLTSSANPSAFGQAVTFTATVTPVVPLPLLTPTGTVTFMDGTTMLGTAMLSPTGTATFMTSTSTPLSAGSHSITAVYS